MIIKRIAPSTVGRENFNKQHARLWEKYRLGKTIQTIKEKKGGKKVLPRWLRKNIPVHSKL